MVWHIINQVWGQAFLDIFLRYSVPSLLAPGNLPALRRKRDVRYKLYTYPADVPTLKASPAFRSLEQAIPVELIAIPSLQAELAMFERVFGGAHKFAAMGACHWHATHRAWESQAVLCLTSPDVVYSDGTLAHLGALADQGKRSALLTGLHTRLETVGPALLQTFPPDGSGAMTLPARELVALALPHRHPVVNGLFYDPEGFDVGSQIYWNVDGGQLIRSWHLQPAMIQPRRLPQVPFWSVDNDYTAQVLAGPEDLHVIDDSDHGFIAELMPVAMERQINCGNRPFNPLVHALTARAMFLVEPHVGRGAHSRANFTRKIRIHSAEIGDTFRAAEAESDRVAADILSWVDFLEARPTALHEMEALSRLPQGQRLADHLLKNLRMELKTARGRMALERWDEAEAACRRAERLAPGRPDPPVHLARLRMAQGRFAEAVATLREALGRAPADPEALRYLAQAEAGLGHARGEAPEAPHNPPRSRGGA